MTGGWLPWRCALLATMRRRGHDAAAIAAALQMPWQAVAARLEQLAGADIPAGAAGRRSVPRDPAVAAPPDEDPGFGTAKDPAPASEIPREGRSGTARKASGTRKGNGSTASVQPAAHDQKPGEAAAPPPAPGRKKHPPGLPMLPPDVDRTAMRKCLGGCGELFRSSGPGERICPKCRGARRQQESDLGVQFEGVA